MNIIIKIKKTLARISKHKQKKARLSFCKTENIIKKISNQKIYSKQRRRC